MADLPPDIRALLVQQLGRALASQWTRLHSQATEETNARAAVEELAPSRGDDAEVRHRASKAEAGRS